MADGLLPATLNAAHVQANYGRHADAIRALKKQLIVHGIGFIETSRDSSGRYESTYEFRLHGNEVPFHKTIQVVIGEGAQDTYNITFTSPSNITITNVTVTGHGGMTAHADVLRSLHLTDSASRNAIIDQIIALLNSLR